MFSTVAKLEIGKKCQFSGIYVCIRKGQHFDLEVPNLGAPLSKRFQSPGYVSSYTYACQLGPGNDCL